MKDMLSAIKPIELLRHRINASSSPCTDEELSHVRRISGDINVIGHGCLHQECYSCSELLQRCRNIVISDLIFCIQSSVIVKS